MRARLIWSNLVDRKLRLLASLLGISLAIVPLFLQIGLWDAMLRSAVLFYNHLDFDLVIRSDSYLHFAKSADIPLIRVAQARAQPGVESVAPLDLGFGSWLNPQTGERRELMVVASRPEEMILRLPGLDGKRESIRQSDALFFDRRSRPEFGQYRNGDRTELQGQRVEIVGQYRLGGGFSSLGTAFVDRNTFQKLGLGRPSRASLGLVRLEPGVSPSTGARTLREALPGDVTILSREEAVGGEKEYWVEATSLGIIIAFGLVVSLVVGVTVIYQIVATEMDSRTAEYAMLRAIGYTDRFLTQAIVEQTVLLAGFAFWPALLTSWFLYRWTAAATYLPMEISPGRSLMIFVVSVGMAAISGLLAVRKLKAVSPAELFN